MNDRSRPSEFYDLIRVIEEQVSTISLPRFLAANTACVQRHESKLPIVVFPSGQKLWSLIWLLIVIFALLEALGGPCLLLALDP